MTDGVQTGDFVPYDFTVGDPFFADEKPDYLLISNHVVLALLDAGVAHEQIDQMMVENPKRFFRA